MLSHDIRSRDLKLVNANIPTPGFTDLATADDRTRWTFIWDRVQRNPHIVAHYLVIRLQAFTEHVLCLLLGFTGS